MTGWCCILKNIPYLKGYLKQNWYVNHNFSIITGIYFELILCPCSLVYTLCFICLFQSSDPIVEKLYESTEEGKKVTRNNGDKFLAVFRRIPDNFKQNDS